MYYRYKLYTIQGFTSYDHMCTLLMEVEVRKIHTVIRYKEGSEWYQWSRVKRLYCSTTMHFEAASFRIVDVLCILSLVNPSTNTGMIISIIMVCFPCCRIKHYLVCIV